MSSRSGAEVRDALFNGRPVSWGFNPKERRVILQFPKVLGGEKYVLCIAGYYTFVARPVERSFIPKMFSTHFILRGARAIKHVFRRSTAWRSGNRCCVPNLCPTLASPKRRSVCWI